MASNYINTFAQNVFKFNAAWLLTRYLNAKNDEMGYTNIKHHLEIQATLPYLHSYWNCHYYENYYVVDRDNKEVSDFELCPEDVTPRFLLRSIISIMVGWIYILNKMHVHPYRMFT